MKGPCCTGVAEEAPMYFLSRHRSGQPNKNKVVWQHQHCSRHTHSIPAQHGKQILPSLSYIGSILLWAGSQHMGEREPLQ